MSYMKDYALTMLEARNRIKRGPLRRRLDRIKTASSNGVPMHEPECEIAIYGPCCPHLPQPCDCQCDCPRIKAIYRRARQDAANAVANLQPSNDHGAVIWRDQAIHAAGPQ